MAVIVRWLDAPDLLDALEYLVAPEWACLDALVWPLGTVETGTAKTGAVVTGMVEIGTVRIGTAIGIIIMVTITLTSSSSVVSAFRGGGAGVAAGVGDIRTTVIRTVTTGTAMDIRVTATAAMDMATMGTETAMATAMATTANTALPLGRE